jgi:hypothetical protein
MATEPSTVDGVNTAKLKHMPFLLSDSLSYLGVHASADRIQTPIASVIVVQVNFAKPNPRMPLTACVEKTMMNGHTNNAVIDVIWICSDQHSLVMPQEMASRDGDISAVTSDIDESVIKVLQSAPIYPYILTIRFHLNTVHIVPSASFKF